MKNEKKKKEKDLRKLSRADLLQMLIYQTKEVERLQEELRIAEEKLSQRQIMFDEVGNIAEAALKINNVMEAAQEAADQYLENIARFEQNARQKYRNDPIGKPINEKVW